MELALPHRVRIPGRAVARRKQQAETVWFPSPDVSAKVLYQEWGDFTDTIPFLRLDRLAFVEWIAFGQNKSWERIMLHIAPSLRLVPHHAQDRNEVPEGLGGNQAGLACNHGLYSLGRQVFHAYIAELGNQVFEDP